MVGAALFAYQSLNAIKERFPERIAAKAPLGGMLMMNGEAGHAVALRSVDASCLPTIADKSGRHLMMLFLSVAFIVGASLVPIEKLMKSKAMDLSGPITNYQNQIDVLEKEKVITPELAEQLEEQLNQMFKRSSSIDPANTWQALDPLRPEIDLHLRSSFAVEPIEEEQLEQWEKKAADAGIAPGDFLVIKKDNVTARVTRNRPTKNSSASPKK